MGHDEGRCVHLSLIYKLATGHPWYKLSFMEQRSIIETWPAEAVGSAIEGAAIETGPVFLDAHIRPNRSLPNPGFYAVMTALVIFSFLAGIAFISIGAWPVIGFFGLDILLVWMCFKLNYRDGKRLEIVRITHEDIEVVRQGPTGLQSRYRMPAAWTKVQLTGKGEPDSQARLSAMGKNLIIGSFLSPKEREGLADAVQSALDEARRYRPQETGGSHS